MDLPLSNSFELSSYFDLTPDWVCLADRTGFFKKVNKAVLQQTGYTADELYRAPINSFIHPDDRQPTADNRAHLLSGHALLNFVNRYIAKDGSVIWLEWSSIYFAEQQVVFGIAKDITKRKLAEIAVEEQFRRLKRYATHVKSTAEQDRKQLAYELHEELAQLLAAVKFDIELIADKVSDNADVKQLVDHAEAVCALSIKTIKHIAFAVSPAMLNDVGLAATLEWLCAEYTILYNVHATYAGAINETALSQEIKLDVFRICQDAMMLLAEQKSLSQLAVQLSYNETMLQLEICSNGFHTQNTEATMEEQLTAVRERAHFIDGKVKFKLQDAGIAIIRMDIPVRR